MQEKLHSSSLAPWYAMCAHIGNPDGRRSQVRAVRPIQIRTEWARLPFGGDCKKNGV